MKIAWIGALALAAMLAAPLATHAAEARPAADDPVLEARIMRLAEELRCLVCQNETLAGSNAELAVDLRREMRDLARAGRSDDQIVDFLVQRYGEYVLYRPRFKAATALLWLGPFLLLAAASAGLLLYVKRRSQRQAVPALSEEERRRAAALLASAAGDKDTA